MNGFRLLPPEASQNAPLVDSIYFGLIGISGFIVLLVAALVVVFSTRYRSAAEAARHALPKWLSREIEIGWTALTLFLALSIFGWAASQNLAQLRPPADPLDMHVVAKQWMWKAEHPNGTREINELHVPAGRDIRLSLNSQDVIHSFYVPAFRIKRDVVPGRTEQIWFRPTAPGTYHLFCAEFCGTNHSRMTGRIVVLEPEAYARWASVAPQTEDLAGAGGRLFRAYGCSGCHFGGGTVRAPDLRGVFGGPVPLADGRVITADERYIRDSILFPRREVAAGYEPVMPSFRGRLAEGDLLRLVAYVKSLGAEDAP